MPVLPIDSRVSPSGGIMQQTAQASQSGRMLQQAAGAVAESANNVFRTNANQAEEAARNEQRAANDRLRRIQQMDEEQALQDGERASVLASDVKLKKTMAFENLKATAAPDSDFFAQWKKIEQNIDQEVGAQPSGVSDPLSKKLRDQNEDFGIKAIAHQAATRQSSAAWSFEKQNESTKRGLLIQEPHEADGELDKIAAEHASDPSLAQLNPLDADKKSADAMRESANIVGKRLIQSEEGATDLLGALYGSRVAKKAARGEDVFDADGNLVSPITIKVAGGKWDSLISQASDKEGLNPDMVAAIIQMESAGDETRKSPKGAAGLMQIMPGTAQELGVNPMDPAQAIAGGAKYFRQQLDKFGGDPYKAAAAYNAGPGTVAKAIAAAEKAGTPDKWRDFMRKFQDQKSFDETKGYLKKLHGLLGMSQDLADGDFIDAPRKQFALTKYATAEDLLSLGKDAATILKQSARTRTEKNRALLNQRIESELKSYAIGKTADQPLQIGDFLASGMKMDEAEVKFADLLQKRSIAPVIANLKDMTRQQRMALLDQRNPERMPDKTGPMFASQVESYQMLQEANERIERQLKADPAGFAAQSNAAVEKAANDYGTLLRTNKDPQQIAQARDHYVASVSAFQRANDIASPALLPQAQVDAIKAKWVGQPDGPLRAAEEFSSLAEQWGPHYGQVLKQFGNDVPSEAMWIGQLADIPSSLGVRTSMASASKMFAEKDIQSMTGVSKERVATAVRAAFSSYIGSLRSTDPQGGADEYWNQLEDGAVKLAALKMATYRMAPEQAAAQAYQELVASHSVFVSEGSQVTASYMADGESLEFNRQNVTVRLPRSWPGKTADMNPENLLDGAKQWVDGALPSMQIQTSRSQESAKADIRSQGYWITSPDDDGLTLMMGGSPVYQKSGKPVSISWQDAATIYRPGFLGRTFDALGKAVTAPFRSAGEAYISRGKYSVAPSLTESTPFMGL